MYAIFASFFGSAGYTLSLLFFSPLVSSSAYLLEPLIAQVLGYVMGLDQLPGYCTAIGSIFAIYGILYIDSGSRERMMLAVRAHLNTLSQVANSNSVLDSLNQTFDKLNVTHTSGR